MSISSISITNTDFKVSEDIKAILRGLELNEQVQNLILEKGVNADTIDEISNLSIEVKKIFTSEPVVKEWEKEYMEEEYLPMFDVRTTMEKPIYLLRTLDELHKDYDDMRKESKYKDSYVEEMDILSVLIHKIELAKRLDEIKAEPRPEKGTCILHF